MNSKSIADTLHSAQQQGLERIEAQLLLLRTLGRPAHDRAWLLTHDTETLDAPTLDAFTAGCQRRMNGEPLAYITGHKEFFGLDLRVDARVLDPRADTETLVDWGLEVIHNLPHPLVLDLGTGSGAIALAIANTRPDAQVSAVDASSDALAVARANAERLGLRVTWLQGDWLETLSASESDVQHNRSYHLIVSNPPYIPSADPHLAALTHEPLNALASGVDGLDDIRRIVAQAPAHLAPDGWLLLEHGYDQADAVRHLLVAQGFAAVQHRLDLAGIARCTGGQLSAARATVK